MLDPLGEFERIRDFYIAYLDTAFRVRHLERQTPRTTADSGRVDDVALFEPVFRYQTDERALEDLVPDWPGNPIRNFSEAGRRAFVELALSGLFPGQPGDDDLLRSSLVRPYRHQMQMLTRGASSGARHRHVGYRFRED